MFMASPRLEGQVEKTVFPEHLELQWRKQCLLGLGLGLRGPTPPGMLSWSMYWVRWNTSLPSVSRQRSIDQTQSEVSWPSNLGDMSVGHPPGAQSRTDSWSWVGGGGMQMTKRLALWWWEACFKRVQPYFVEFQVWMTFHIYLDCSLWERPSTLHIFYDENQVTVREQGTQQECSAPVSPMSAWLCVYFLVVFTAILVCQLWFYSSQELFTSPLAPKLTPQTFDPSIFLVSRAL